MKSSSTIQNRKAKSPKINSHHPENRNQKFRSYIQCPAKTWSHVAQKVCDVLKRTCAKSEPGAREIRFMNVKVTIMSYKTHPVRGLKRRSHQKGKRALPNTTVIYDYNCTNMALSQSKIFVKTYRVIKTPVTSQENPHKKR